MATPRFVLAPNRLLHLSAPLPQMRVLLLAGVLLLQMLLWGGAQAASADPTGKSIPQPPIMSRHCGRAGAVVATAKAWLGCGSGSGLGSRAGTGPARQIAARAAATAPAQVVDAAAGTAGARLEVEGALFTRVSPTPPAGAPYLIAYSAEVARMVGIDPTECERPEFPLLMSGAAPLPGAAPYAAVYGGHQFGQWAGQLGDGRAITLGEVVNPGTGQRWELQLKGGGKTPYSRRADGRAVLRSSLREFVASEAMAALGVPTTRALSLAGTGDAVLRDMFYNGNARLEPGAVVCRVAPSFVRFGTFQLPVSRGAGEVGLVALAADWVIKHHYPQLAGGEGRWVGVLGGVCLVVFP
ncbi:hypothetical protein TSOC_002234, partial [Tetrabaena socialis]